MKRRIVGAAAAVLGTVLIGGAGLQTVSAAPAPAPAAVPTTVTLPLFGAPLTLGITTGPGGALTEVTVDPADGNVATQLKPRKVVFEAANPAPGGDPAKVVVKSKNGGQKVSARAGSLAEISGPGKWAGDVFGDGTASTVDFTIGAAADGGPDITAITTSGAPAVVGTVQHSSGDDDDENEMSAKVSIKFTSTDGDQSRTLTIKAKVETDDDDGTEAKLSISLGRIKGVAVDAAAAAGPKTWTGLLCDGSTATINYTVAADGSVSAVTATPEPDRINTDDDKIEVRFSGDERVKIKVKSEDGQITISASEKIRCRDAADPTTNVSTSIPSDDDDDDDRRNGDHEKKDDKKNKDDDKRGDDDDDASSTTVTTGA